MYYTKYVTLIVLFFATTLIFPQQKQVSKKIIISGKVVEKTSGQPLEYSTLSFINLKTNKVTAGGITDGKGEFTIEINPGNYTIKIEFISFKPLEITNKSFTESANIGIIKLEEDATQLQEVVVRSEKTTVEIKLDKKVYNVGKDLMVKGGTVSDVLDNIPSVAVDVEGNISLRGNENVKVLIDGRPSNAISVTDALRMIPADAIDKVEVITNPSARYDAEGGAGILNIILKKGKTNGLNGTLMATTGYPDNHGINATLNFKSNEFNLFTSQGYNYRNNPGSAHMKTHYLVPNTFTNEDRSTNRINKGYNGNFGAEWFLDKSTTWTNIFSYRKNPGVNEDNVYRNEFDSNQIYTNTVKRFNYEGSKSENVEFSSNLVKKFKKEGHNLYLDANFSINKDDNLAEIINSQSASAITTIDNSKNIQRQSRNLLQVDYSLPIHKNSQFEAGYRGSFTTLLTDYQVLNDGVLNLFFTNVLEYKEYVNALYTQFGTKIKKASILAGMRYEDSDIEVNQLTANLFKNKKYHNFFPSATLAYEISNNSNLSLNYSKRINRPNGRQLNPFTNYSSNINLFQGNPDIDPSLTDAFDIGYLKKWDKLTLNTSLYYNSTTNVVQMIRRENGDFVDGIPVIITTPINLANEYRTGFEFTFNYSPYKWWKLNTNFNFFNITTKGIFSYTNYLNALVIQDFGNKTNSWSSRLTSKITLPQKIDWQTNITYNAPQTYAQGKILGIFAMNLGFSKDVLKDKATIALNVNDVFNSRKRRAYTLTSFIDAYQEMQWRKRQITFSFTYRFNKSKNDKEKERKPRREGDEGGGGEY